MEVASFLGTVGKSEDAALLFDYARQGLCRLLSFRLSPKEQASITPGLGFIYSEKDSEIKRWSDGRLWTDSSSRGEFLLYKECQMVTDPATNQRRKVEVPNGLRKKTIADKTYGSSLRMVFYFSSDSPRIPLTAISPDGKQFSLSPVLPQEQFETKLGLHDPLADYLDTVINEYQTSEHSSPYPPADLYSSSASTSYYRECYENTPLLGHKRKRLDDHAQGASPHIPSTIYLETDDITKPVIQIRHPHGVTSLFLDSLSQFRVESSSSNADFAEYMAAEESQVHLMVPGSVVNLKRGVITTEGFGERLIIPRIVSTAPLILGNNDGTPETRKKMVQIAMVGQVPINVRGKVRKGDFLAAGPTFNDVRAVSEKEMTIESYGRVVGIALEASNTTELKGVMSLVFYPDVSLLSARLLDGEELTLRPSLTLLRNDVEKLQREVSSLESKRYEDLVRKKRAERRTLLLLLLFLCLVFLALIVGLSVFFVQKNHQTDPIFPQPYPPTPSPTPTPTPTPTSYPTSVECFEGICYDFRRSAGPYNNAPSKCVDGGVLAVPPVWSLAGWLKFTANHTHNGSGGFERFWVNEASCEGYGCGVIEGETLTCRDCLAPFYTLCQLPS